MGEREANVRKCPGWCTSGVLDLAERACGLSRNRARASDQVHSSHRCTRASTVETVLSLGVELVVLILDSYLSYVGLYLAY